MMEIFKTYSHFLWNSIGSWLRYTNEVELLQFQYPTSKLKKEERRCNWYYHQLYNLLDCWWNNSEREKEREKSEREKWSGFSNIIWDRRSLTRPTHSLLICFKFTMVMRPIEAVEEGHRSRRSVGCVWSLDDAISQPLDKRAAGRRSIKAARTNNFCFFIRHYLLPCIQMSSVIYGCWWCGNPGRGGSHL